MAGEKILFVDDEEQIRKLLATWLGRHGYAVTLASDGWEALKAIRAAAPDLVITDVNMPNMNGLELTRRLRADHRTARIPVVMLSARKQADDVLTGYAEGADEYIPKPVEMAVLAAKIDVLLKRFKADCKRAGIPLTDDRGRTIDIHALRMSFIDRLAKAGVPPHIVQELARHSDISITMDHYTDVRVNDLHAALATIFVAPFVAPSVAPTPVISGATESSPGKARSGLKLA